MARMVRKQVYITAEQERQLKQRAAELGITEAELIRRGLDNALGKSVEQESGSRSLDPREALQALLAFSESRVGMTVPPSGWKFNREEVYIDTGFDVQRIGVDL